MQTHDLVFFIHQAAIPDKVTKVGNALGHTPFPMVPKGRFLRAQSEKTAPLPLRWRTQSRSSLTASDLPSQQPQRKTEQASQPKSLIVQKSIISIDLSADMFRLSRPCAQASRSSASYSCRARILAALTLFPVLRPEALRASSRALEVAILSSASRRATICS